MITDTLTVPRVRTLRALQRADHHRLLMIGDMFAAVAAVSLALWAWSLTTGFAFDTVFLRRWSAWWLTVPAWLFLVGGSRRLPVALSIEAAVRSIAASAAVLLGLYVVIYFYAPREALPRLPAMYGLWEASLLTFAWRLTYVFIFSHQQLKRRVVLVGLERSAHEVISLLQAVSRDVEVVAIVGDVACGAPVGGIPVLAVGELESLIDRTDVTEVLTGRLDQLSPTVVPKLLRLQERGISVFPISAEYEHTLGRVPVVYLESGWMFSSLPEWIRSRDASTLVKRAVDIVGAFAGGLLLAGLTPLIAVLILFDSGRPIFYRQVRLGAAGKPFVLIKFRTMVPDAERHGPQWAADWDRRATRVGYWLRRTRIDEWPQVINVLRGEMSLVGPRPERPEFAGRLEREIPFYRARLMVAPGITGWAQVNLPYGASVEDSTLKLEYDLYYIKHRSLYFDARILAMTALTVCGFRGR